MDIERCGSANVFAWRQYLGSLSDIHAATLRVYSALSLVILLDNYIGYHR